MLMDNRGVNFNPELEEIRNKVLEESVSHDDTWIRTLIDRTSRIHAGFLFEDVKVLQNLCLYIGESQNKITDPGWQAFGYHLGLNPSLIKVLNHNNFNKEDPTYNILLAFVQHEDATIGKVIQALWNLGRIDVIFRIKKSVNELADIILHLGDNLTNNSSRETSDYGSEQISNERNSINSGSDSDNIDNGTAINGNSIAQCNHEDIIKPYVIPPAPFIFQNIKTTPEMTSLKIQHSLNNQKTPLTASQVDSNDLRATKQYYMQKALTKSHSNIVIDIETSSASAVDSPDKSGNKQKYSKIIMLTFAPDGEKYAKEVSQLLRSKSDSFNRIGVLILSEHVKEVAKDPYHFITGAFHQVDYVCPILTESYFNIIRRKEQSSDLSDLHLDSRYVQLIYALMNKYYVSNRCINDKIRCIIPDELVQRIQFNLLMNIPIFSAWVKLGEVDEMAVQLIKSRF